MAKPSKHRAFSVQMAVCVWMDVAVNAESPEAALTHAKGLKVADLVDINGTHNDSRVEVAGVFEQGVLDRAGF